MAGMQLNLTGKVIAVTGGASGIGLATINLLLSSNASVSAIDSNPSSIQIALTTLTTQHGPKAESNLLFLQSDVRDRTQIETWLTQTISKFGKLDGAANCAGVIGKHHGLKSVFELEDDQWDLIMSVNLKGTMNCMRAQLPLMSRGGSVVCVTSIESTMGFAGHGAYNASKHGLLGLVRCAALEMGPKGIRVNGVAPGITDTAMVRDRDAALGSDSFTNVQESALGRAAQPGEVANAIVFLLSDAASYINGANLNVDGARVTANFG